MRSMGFCEEWIAIIMKCISNVEYSVVINGRSGEEFQSQRGLRQGDPLSPYFLFICAEEFSCLIKIAKEEGRILATKVGSGSVSVTHLFFANDSMLFGEASVEGANNMKKVIKEYEMMSGQLVNFEKSLIYFSGNTDHDMQN